MIPDWLMRLGILAVFCVGGSLTAVAGWQIFKWLVRMAVDVHC